jgi:peptidoglycan/LPS O-acetylase OafA/YrhL
LPPLDPPPLRRFLANLTMAPLLLGERVVDLPYWTLTYEMVFYALMALVLALGRLRSIEWICLAWMASGVLVAMLLDLRLHYRTTIMLTAYHSNFFVIGMCLYILHVGRGRAVTWITLLAAVAMSARGGGEQAFYAPGTFYLPMTAAFALAVWFATTALGQRLAPRPLVFLGRISFPLYLVHVVLGFQVIRFGVQHGWSTAQGVAAAVTLSLLAATLLHYFVERPGERLSRGLLGVPGPAQRRPDRPRVGSAQSVDRLDLVD